MKKIFLVIAFLIGLGQMSYGQIFWGAKVGGNLSNIKEVGNGLDSFMKASYNLGIVGRAYMGDRFFVQPELIYSIKGYEQRANTQVLKYDLAYADLMMILGVELFNSFNLEVGPNLGFLLQAKRQDGNGSTTGVNVRRNYKDINFGLNAGASYNLTDDMNIGARYDLGLYDLNDIYTFPDENNVDIKPELLNRTIQVYAVYFF